MNLPPFPTDDGTLDMIMLAIDPGPEAERSSLLDLLDFLSQLGHGGSAVSEVEVIDPGSEHEPAIVFDPAPSYSVNDMVRALIDALREARGTKESA